MKNTNISMLETTWIYNSNFEDTEEIAINGEMINAPNIVLGYFACSKLGLTTLKNCPEEVFGAFHCDKNSLTSLKYCPKYVKTHFNCDNNSLTSLKHCPKIINGYFSCENNELTSLEFGPEYVANYFYCNDNPLISLNHGPKKIGDFIYTDEYLKIERGLLKKGYIDYYPDLLKYCIEKNIDLKEINWPEGFLTEEIKTSVKGLSKFDL